MEATKVEVSGFHYMPSVLVTSSVQSNKSGQSNKNNSGQSSVQSNWTTMIRVKAPPVGKNCVLIHVVVVLQHAGKRKWGAETSSSREPSRFNLLKTMEFIIEQFREYGKGDHLTVVVANSKGGDISEMPIVDWISDLPKWQKLEEEGTNALSEEGLQLAVNILEKKESGANRAGFILLLSDDAHSELKCKDSLLSRYPVHAFGLGNHDPAVLHRIAEISKGTYSCITGSEIMEEAIALCLKGLKTVVAVKADVHIKVARFGQIVGAGPSSIMKEFEIIKIQSGGHTATTDKGRCTQDGHWASGKITVGVLYADEVKHFIVDIVFSSSREAGEKTRAAVLTAHVKYNNSSISLDDIESEKCELPLLVTMISDAAAIKGYEKLQLVPCCHIVLQQMIWFDVLEALVSFANDLKMMQEGSNLVAALQKKRGELNEKKSFQMAQKMGLDLGGTMWKDIDKMLSLLDEERGSEGLGSIYSCVSSYWMQRVATTGLLHPATTFLTPVMKEMVENARKKQLAKESRAKSMYATGLFDRVEELLRWFKMYPTTESSSSGGPDESSKLVVDFIESLIYEAADLSVNQWRRTTSPGKPMHSTPAAPPTPPQVEGDNPTVVEANKPKCAIELLDKIDKLLNLSKMCGASDESQKRVDGLIRCLLYEVTSVTIDEWWRVTSSAPKLEWSLPVEDEGDVKSKRIANLLQWRRIFPATGGDDVLQKRVDALMTGLICNATVVHNDTPPAGSPR